MVVFSAVTRLEGPKGQEDIPGKTMFSISAMTASGSFGLELSLAVLSSLFFLIGQSVG